MGLATSKLHFPCNQTHDDSMMMTLFGDFSTRLIHQLEQSSQNIEQSHQRMVDKFEQINKELTQRIEHQTRVLESSLALDHPIPLPQKKKNIVENTSCSAPNCRNQSNHGDDWKRHNIFKTRANCGGKLCSLVIDGGSTVNVVATHVADKLKLAREAHPWPYKIAWICDDLNIVVTERCLVPVCIGTYIDQVQCDVVPMTATDVLLGRPWLYDRNVFHDGRENTYSFKYNRGDFTLIPQKPKEAGMRRMMLSSSTCTIELEEEEEEEEEDKRFSLECMEMKLW